MSHMREIEMWCGSFSIQLVKDVVIKNLKHFSCPLLCYAENCVQSRYGCYC